jgi:hypothetical protein
MPLRHLKCVARNGALSMYGRSHATFRQQWHPVRVHWRQRFRGNVVSLWGQNPCAYHRCVGGSLNAGGSTSAEVGTARGDNSSARTSGVATGGASRRREQLERQRNRRHHCREWRNRPRRNVERRRHFEQRGGE